MHIHLLDGRLTILPAEFPGTLAIQISTDNRPDCGLFQGQHGGFLKEEHDKPVPKFKVDYPDRRDDVDKLEEQYQTEKQLAKDAAAATGLPLEPEEEDEPVNPNIDPLGYYDFVIDRPARSGKDRCLSYYFVAQWHVYEVYVSRLHNAVIQLQEIAGKWSVSIRGVTIVLDDYEPGWIARSGKTPL